MTEESMLNTISKNLNLEIKNKKINSDQKVLTV